MSAKEIKEQIDSLSPERKKDILNHLGMKLRKEEAFTILSKIRGRGKNILGLDAQEYVNKLREDDRS
jgi:hypothetical protein